MIKWLLRMMMLALIAGVLVTGWLFYQPLPIKQESVVRILPGASFDTFIAQLSREQQLGDSVETLGRQWLLRAYGRLSGLSQKLQVGEYPCFPQDNLITIVRRVEQGKSLQRSVTLIEGWNFSQLRQMFVTVPLLDNKLADLSDEAVAQLLGLDGMKVEGWLAPDTYFYVLGDSDLDVIRRAHVAQKTVLQQAWAQRAPDLPYATPYDALIMASLIEKETAVKSEMPRIAGVFVLRLNKKMRLQTDPTVIYAMGDAYQGNIRRKDLALDSPYNTYRNAGLPPTPIAMPGKEAIQAAMQPDITGDLYFVARGDGSHQFSRTLEAHNQAVRQYQLRRSSDYRSTPAAGAAP